MLSYIPYIKDIICIIHHMAYMICVCACVYSSHLEAERGFKLRSLLFSSVLFSPSLPGAEEGDFVQVAGGSALGMLSEP